MKGRSSMGNFTFIPIWVIQDILVYLMTAGVIFYIVKKEARPVTVLMEMSCFVLLYASVYENVATIMKWYGYGRSLIMVFNVPLSIPLFEFLVLYCSLKLMEHMQIPTWIKPILAGFFGVVADFSLDPVAVKQIFTTMEGTIGRWSWFPGPHDVVIYGEPVYNFTGWMYITGYAALFFLLGRWWYRRSGYSSLVGYLYPVLASLAALLVLLTPLTTFFTFGTPFGAKGSASEWVMLTVALVVPVVLLAVSWRGRMKSGLSLKGDSPLFFFLLGSPVIGLIFCLFGGFWQILWLVLLAGVAMWVLVVGIYLAGRKVLIPNRSSATEMLEATRPA